MENFEFDAILIFNDFITELVGQNNEDTVRSIISERD